MVQRKPLDARYGCLTVIRRTGANALVECKCDCGTDVVIASASDLRAGKIVSCGCAKGRKPAALLPAYGKWTVLGRDGRKARCRCECGTERNVSVGDLRSGKSTNCGCKRDIAMRAAQLASVTTHGASQTVEYRIWIDMRRRCHDASRPDFHRYGGRGIVVCDRWRDSFENFFSDMGRRPKGRTLERRDNDGPYSPDNCFWATKTQQQANTRKSVVVSVAGERMTAQEASLRLGGERNLVARRLKQGWSMERATSEPPKRTK